MSFFSDMQSAQVEESKDSVGDSFGPMESGIYDTVIKYAYTGESLQGAKSITFGFEANGKEFNETMYITNRNKQTYYEKDGKKFQMLGYEMAESIALLTVGKKLPDLNQADKVIELYDFELGAKKPTKVNMLTELVGKEFKAGILKVKEFKKKKDANGVYQNTDEVREYNQVNKAFRSKDDKTVNEIRAKKETAEFINDWKDKWEGVTKDSTNGATTTTAKTETKSNTDSAIDDSVFA